MPAKCRLPAAIRQCNAPNSALIAVTDQSQRRTGSRLACLACPASSAHLQTDPELLGCNLDYKVGPPQARAAAATVAAVPPSAPSPFKVP